MKIPVFFIIIASFLISCKKNSVVIEKVETKDTILQKDGTVLSYEKPKKDLVAFKRDQTVYSEKYLQRLRKIAEYYIANSQQNLVKFHSSKPDAVLGYSYEQGDWEDVMYTQIGIFTKSGKNLSTLQWLFYEPKSQKLYEFDLNKKQLTEFK